MQQKRVIYFLIFFTAVFPAVSFAAVTEELVNVYRERLDLQAAFDPVTYRWRDAYRGSILLDLEDWAYQYGWREEPTLATFAPVHIMPVRVDRREIEQQTVSQSYVVMDQSTGKILTVKREHQKWPIASLTKLVTAEVVLEEQVSETTIASVQSTDDVGGAKLYVSDGDQFTVDDLFYATLVASANNAANALSRTTKLSKELFVEKMNAFATGLNLSKTHFVDPTGIEVENQSTPLEMARLARAVFANPNIHAYTTTAVKWIEIVNQHTTKKLTNTNWMLWKPQYDDVFVTGGKTGFLNESGWNLAVSLQPNADDKNRELVIVIFGAPSRVASFEEAEKLAKWAWNVYEWQ